MKRKIIVAITGASGSIYAVEFLKIMHGLDIEVHGIISSSGEQVLKLETGKSRNDLLSVSRWFELDNFAAPVASGSSFYQGMAVLPCSMGTLGGIANGISKNLIHRAADVTLKERRPLVLAVRESPLNRVHLQNMLSVNDAGAIICPAMPAFYHKPESITEMAREFSARVAQLLGIEVPGMSRWQGLEC
nr:UbiX family flavin prenyltransferase [Desulfobulbaceae bacterium]